MVSAAEVAYSSGCKDRRKHYGSRASAFPKMQYQAGRPKVTDLQDFYTKQLERVKANSVIHYHANIHKALKYAVKIDLIPTNPADKVKRPKKNEFKGSYYSAEEIHALTEIAEGEAASPPIS